MVYAYDFYEFCWLFDLRNTWQTNGRKCAKPLAGRTHLGRPARHVTTLPRHWSGGKKTHPYCPEPWISRRFDQQTRKAFFHGSKGPHAWLNCLNLINSHYNCHQGGASPRLAGWTKFRAPRALLLMAVTPSRLPYPTRENRPLDL